MAITVTTRLKILCAVVAAVIFAIDLRLALGVAGGVPYVALVLIGNWLPRILHLYVLAALGTALTILGYFLSPGGGALWVVLTNRALALFGIWITAFLIANRKQAERGLREKESELRRVSRLSDMGQITSALAHEINQPLTAIATYIQAAHRILEKGGDDAREQVYENLDKAVAQSTRAAGIIRRLRQFIGKETAEYTRDSINAIIEESCALTLTDAAGKGVRMRMNLARNLPWVMMDRVQIQQVVVNLLLNSLDAMMDSVRRELTVITKVVENEFVEVCVRDTGPGISKDIADQLFKPYVTTKPNGMGVGLSICRSIIDEHGGRLWTEENPDGGATFCFTLPIIAGTTSNHDQ